MSAVTSYEHITAELTHDGRLLALQLNKPKANVLTSAMMQELRDALRLHQAEPHLRAVTLSAAGDHFSFGASIEEHAPPEVDPMLAMFHSLVREVAAYPVPVVALVDGRCLGGAFELVLACHVVLATARARFACPEVKLGVFPPVLAVLGPYRLGNPTTEEMLLTGCEIDAARAHQLGVVNVIVDGDVRVAGQRYFEARLAPLSAYALRQATAAARQGSGLVNALWEKLDELEALYFEKVVPSHDGAEGIRAFLAKEPPRWVDA